VCENSKYFASCGTGIAICYVENVSVVVLIENIQLKHSMHVVVVIGAKWGDLLLCANWGDFISNCQMGRFVF
jgi:hypothetical protein